MITFLIKYKDNVTALSTIVKIINNKIKEKKQEKKKGKKKSGNEKEKKKNLDEKKNEKKSKRRKKQAYKKSFDQVIQISWGGAPVKMAKIGMVGREPKDKL